MSDLAKARLLPGIPFEAKARKKRTKGNPAPASTCTPPFDKVRPFLTTAKPLVGLTEPAAAQPEPAPRLEPVTPEPDHDENLAA